MRITQVGLLRLGRKGVFSWLANRVWIIAARYAGRQFAEVTQPAGGS